ncbi:MAG: hypothetical protein SNG47_05355 [Rikenellaceae bacterium]
MENKLQELTQKLYNEGLERGRTESEQMITQAKAEAKKILAEAKAEAEAMVKGAKHEAEDAQKNALTEIALAGGQALSKIKAEIENTIVTKSTGEALKGAAMDGAFIKDMLLAVAKSWDGASSSKISLEALLPEASKKSLDAALKKSTTALLDAGVEVGYSKSVKSGFKIGAKNGGYYISFTEEDFDALMRGYLRAKVSEILFKA